MVDRRIGKSPEWGGEEEILEKALVRFRRCLW